MDIAMAMDGKEGVFSIDSKPVKVCQNVRAKRCAMGRMINERAPQWGYRMHITLENLLSQNAYNTMISDMIKNSGR